MITMLQRLSYPQLPHVVTFLKTRVFQPLGWERQRDENDAQATRRLPCLAGVDRRYEPTQKAGIKKLNSPPNPDLALESYVRFYSCSIRNRTNQSEFEVEGGVRRTITDSVPSPLSTGAPSTCIAKEAAAEAHGVRLLDACTV